MSVVSVLNPAMTDFKLRTVEELAHRDLQNLSPLPRAGRSQLLLSGWWQLGEKVGFPELEEASSYCLQHKCSKEASWIGLESLEG